MNSIFDTIKGLIATKLQWFRDTSGLAKFVMILCVLITIINIGGNIYSTNQANVAKTVISQKVEEQKEVTHEAFSGLDMSEITDSLSDFFDGIGRIGTSLAVFLITIMVSLAVYYVCKPFDWFRKIAEIFAELDEDWCALKFILGYDVISAVFSIYTIYGMATC